MFDPERRTDAGPTRYILTNPLMEPLTGGQPAPIAAALRAIVNVTCEEANRRFWR